MKLTPKERQFLTLLRKLDPEQREAVLKYMNRTISANVLANNITARVSGLQRLKVVGNSRIKKVYGLPEGKTRPGSRSR